MHTVNTYLGQILIESCSTAEKYDIDALRKQLWKRSFLGRGDGMDAMNVMGEAIWIPKYPLDEPPSDTSLSANTIASASTKSGEIFIFENGSYVTWNMNHEDAKGFAESFLRGSPSYDRDGTNGPVEIEKYKETQMEAMGFIVRSGENTGVRDDLIVVGTNVVASSGDGYNNATATTEDSLGGSSHPPLATAIEPLHGSLHSPASTIDDQPLSASSLQSFDDSTSGTSTSQVRLPRTEDGLRARLSLSSGLARSTKLAVYEEMLEDLMDE